MGKKEGESARHSYGLWFFLAVVAVLTMGLSAWCFLTLHSMKKATPGDNPPVVVQYEKNAEVSEVLLKNEVREIVRAEYETYQNDMQNMLAVAAIVFTIFSIAMPIMNYVFLQKEHVEKLREQMQDVENAKTNAEAAQKAAQAAEKDAERLVFSMLAKLAEVNEIKTAIEGRLATCEIENCNANNRMNMMMEQFRNFSNQLSAMQSGKETGQGQGATIQPLSDSVEDKADAFYKRYLAAPRGSKQELELISEAVKLAPNNAHYVANRGYALHRLKRYEEALEDETEAIRLEPTNAEYYQARGSTLHEIKDYEKALADKTEAVRLEQTNAVYYHQRAINFHEMNRYEEARADETEAIRLDPTNAEYYCSRGLTLCCMTCYKEALADATEAIRLNPMNGRYYHGRSGILRRIARYEEALADITEAIKLEPTNAAYYKSRGTTLDVMNRYENALADYERAIALDATDAATYENRAETYHALADAAETDTQKAEYLRLAQADDDTAKALRSK